MSGMTRARQRAVISHAANRRIYANWQSSIPSRFIDELPDAHVERSGSAALARDRMLAAPVFSGQFPVVARRPRDVEAWEAPVRAAPAEPIPVGTRVFHDKFGYGTVTASADHKLDIVFEKAGAKRLLDSFVQRA